MRVLIIEDEFPAAERLSSLLQKTVPNWEILDVLDSVQHAQTWLASEPAPDLIFSDIQLSDGLSFEIYATVPVKSPIIFTTAYDQYAIQAFKVKSIDYLLKPIKQGDLQAAIQKYYTFKAEFSPANTQKDLQEIWKEAPGHHGKLYQTRFLLKLRKGYKSLGIEQIAYFFAANDLVYVMDTAGQKYPVDFTLDQVTEAVDPEQFFRLNRQVLSKLDHIATIHPYFNGRLKLELTPALDKEVIVSRDRSRVLKKWLGGELM